MKSFYIRIITGIFLLAFLFLGVFGPRWLWLLLVMLVSSLGVLEFHQVVVRGNLLTLSVTLLSNLALQGIAFTGQMDILLLSILSVLMAFLLIMLFTQATKEEVFASFFSFLYIGGLLSFLLLFPRRNPAYVLLVFLASWAQDTFAYCAGMLFGKHPLCPAISHKKTIEGAIGGMVGAQLFTIPFQLLFFPELSWGIIFPAIFFGSIVSQLGDLIASYFKREVGVKDYGNIFRGHGGILDRFDSVLFAAPVVWILLTRFL